MFYYEIRVARSTRTGGGGKRRSTTTEYMEALKPEYVGERLAQLLVSRSVVRVTFDRISQAKFIRKTRSD